MNMKNHLRLTVRLVTKKGMLYQGDCLALLKKLKSNSIDCIFADPPFNLGKNYGSNKVTDQLPEEKYLEWTHCWLSECARVLKPGGSLFIYHVPKWLVQISNYLNRLENLDFRHWIAIKMKNGFPVRGRLHPAHYGLLYYTKQGRKKKFHIVRVPSPVCRHCGELIRDYGGYRKKYKTNNQNIPLIQLADIWDDVSPNIHRKSRPKTINELPLVIPERAILMSTNKGDIVLDPFAGGGGTLSVAEINGRYWIGSELGTTTHASRRILMETKLLKKEVEPPNKIRNIFITKER